MARNWGSPDDEQNLSEAETRELMCEIGRRMWQGQMADANSGNMSCRIANDLVLATPTFISKGFMEPDDLVVLDLEGNQVSGKRKKTSEVLLHMEVYRRRPDARAVVHAHPRNVVAFAITQTAIPSCVLPEMELMVGETPLAAYGAPGGQEFADTLRPYIDDHTAFLLAQHGALTLGRGLIEAFWRMEILEGFCAMTIAAGHLGPLKNLSQDDMNHILLTKMAWGQPDRRTPSPKE